MRCISLFSGCGGLDLGLSGAGFEILLANDNDPLCVASHVANSEYFPSSRFLVKPSEELGEADLKSVLAAGQVDLLAGGPPCPPFSKSRFYRREKPRALEDPLASSTIGAYLKVLRLVQPRAFLLENVPGFAYLVHNEALTRVLEEAQSLGYNCCYDIINAADYGVPQIRERFFLVGLRHGVFKFPPPTHAQDSTDNLFSERLPAWRTAGEVLTDLDTNENASDAGHYAGGRFHDLLVQIPPGDNYLYFTEKRGHPNPVFKWRSRYWSFLLKLSPDLPSWTIQARRSNNMGPFHWRNRILRIEEVKRLQTFPDNWYVAGKTDQQWHQLGNAVPPRLAYHLGEALRMQLTSADCSIAFPVGESPI